VHRAGRAEVLHGTGAGNSESEAPDGKDVWWRRMTNRFQLVAAAVDWLTVNRSVGEARLRDVVPSWRNRRDAESSGPLAAKGASR